MIRARSVRDRERVDYEMGRSIKMMRDAATLLSECQFHKRAEALNTQANNLERAANAQETGFDWFGGRDDWLKEQEERAA